MSESSEITRRLVQQAYELGWRDACHDHLAQGKDPSHPIGHSKRTAVGPVIAALDPNNLLGLT